MQVGRIGTVIFHNLQRSINPGLRFMSKECVSSLKYKQYGEPADVLQLTNDTIETSCLNQDEVVVKWLYAPINPADINTIQGKYPSKPPLPAVPGNEGVGEILAAGSSIKDLCIGDRVVPNGVNKGTWRTCGVYKSSEVFKVSKDLDAITASMLNVNPCTAYRMLKDFIDLKPGDTVIQNGANSAVGQFVIQLCKIYGYKSVNIVRNRPDIDTLKCQLKDLGATEVLTEEELRQTDIFKSGKLKKPLLALNCVCGKNATEVQRHMGKEGVMVTYGGMSREPLVVPASSLIFKDLQFKGFWMTAWTEKNPNSEERCTMFTELQTLFLQKQLVGPSYQLVSLCDYKEAVANALKPGDKKGQLKYILDLQRSG